MNRLLLIVSIVSLTLTTVVGTAEAGSRNRSRVARREILAGWNVPQPREIQSDLCATNERAEKDARKKLATEVKEWLAKAGIDPSWTPPPKLVDRMVIGQAAFEPVSIEDLDVVRATLTADFSEAHRREIVEAYNRQAGGRRLVFLGGGLAVILASLAAVSGYIKADEATKGYYTKRLRTLALVGVGIAGVLVYRMLHR